MKPSMREGSHTEECLLMRGSIWPLKKNYKQMKLYFYCILSLAFLVFDAKGQQILVDRGTRSEGLWCFPLYTDTLTYLYLPSQARLAMDEDSLPNFSFIRYVTERLSEESSPESITEAGGGGILHFLVLYDTPQEQINKAETTLRKKFKNDNIKIRGPVVFNKGRYALISSILNPSDGTEEQKLLATGEAPVLENSRIALSFEMDPQHSKLLLESFKMATPDISLVFDLSFSGLTDNYDAELEVDWSEVRNSQSFGAGGSVYFISADVELGFDELRRNNAIKLTASGSNEAMESLLNTVYSKLLELMFEPVEPDQVPQDQRGGLADAIATMISSDGPLSSRNTTGFGAHVSYQLKQMNSEGKSHLFFKGRADVSRHHYVTFNAGNLYHTYGHNQNFFRDVNLWDPAFQQREVLVGIDGSLEEEIDKMLNSVTVTLRKAHENGEVTIKNVILNKEALKNYTGALSMTYLNQGDSQRTHWLEYEHQSIWQFKGGGTFATEWKKETASMINLYTPFQRRNITLEGDLESLSNEGVRAISVQIDYPFFDQHKEHRITLRPGDNLGEKGFEITLPNHLEEVGYTITWMKKNHLPVLHSGKDKYGIIFIDELPQTP